MKLKTCHTALLIAVFFTLLIPFSVLAQEDKGGFLAEVPTKESEKQDQEMLSGTEDPETRSSKNSNAAGPLENVVLRDSEAKNLKPVTKTVEKLQKEEEKVQKEEEKMQKEEEDPLSFNFLYYIIEKFKLSDIVE